MSTNIVYLVTDLAQSTPRIKPVLRDSLNKRLSRRSKETNAEFKNTLKIASNELPVEDFNSGVLDSLERYYENRFEDRRSDFQKITERIHVIWSLTLLLFVTALAGIISGIFLVSSGKSLAGVSTATAGIICACISIALLKLASVENSRLDEISKELHALADTYTAMGYIDRISDLKGKGEALEDLIKAILYNEQQSIPTNEALEV